MNNAKLLGALCCIALWVSGCATTPAEDPVLTKLTELENRLVSIERVVNNQSLVGLQGQLDQVREEIRGIRGESETLQFQSDEAAKRARTQYLDLDSRIVKLEQGRSGGAFPSLVGANSGVAADGDRQAYEAAFELLKTGRYDEAKTAFGQFTAAYANSPLADNANYWLAEAHYVTGDYPAALSQFQTMIANFPTSAKVPDAWLKIGYCQYETGAYAEARASLESVVGGYPDTTPARLAQQRLQQMSAEGR